MAGYLLDTNVWLRVFGPIELLSPKVRKLVASTRPLHLASISLWEVVMAVDRGRVDLRMTTGQWFRIALPEHRIRILHLTPEIALEVERLADRMHGDPADRIIAATANVHRMTLLTSDKTLLAFEGVSTIDTMP